jgi:phosphoglycolate phosphatase
MSGTQIKAVIFDKDGTLFDFRLSWGGWTAALLKTLAPYTQDDAVALARKLGFDPKAMQFAPDSAVIAQTTFEIAALVHPLLEGMTLKTLMATMDRLGIQAPMVPAVALREVLGGLKARGLKLGLATNDTEAPARAHLDGAGVIDLFDFIAGCDSGYGGKPAPGQLLAFATAVGVPSRQIAMVGDSLHDLDAAKAAGMKAVGVLTGPALRATLTPHADVVLGTIAELAGWIDGFPQG